MARLSHHDRMLRRQEMAALVSSGVSELEVAGRFGVHVSTVKGACAENGVSKLYRRRDKIIRDIRGGVPYDTIISRYKTNIGYIRALCNRHGIPFAGRSPRLSSFQILKKLLDGQSGASIASDFNVSRQRVDQIASKARSAGFDL